MNSLLMRTNTKTKLSLTVPRLKMTAMVAETSKLGTEQPESTTHTYQSIEHLVKELRALSMNSQSELDEVNCYLTKLEELSIPEPEKEDPIMTFDLENLRQAIRETVVLSDRYKAACKSMEHYLSKLEAYCTDTTRGASATAAMDDALENNHEMKSLLKYVDRCIARCCSHVDEYGCKYKDLSNCLGVIIDKYCELHPTTAEPFPRCFPWNIDIFLFGEPDDQRSECPPLFSKRSELEGIQEKVDTIVSNTGHIKKVFLDLERIDIDSQSCHGDTVVRGTLSSLPEMTQL